MDNLIISGNSCFCFFFLTPFEEFARVWGTSWQEEECDHLSIKSDIWQICTSNRIAAGFRRSRDAANGWECAHGHTGTAKVFCLPSGMESFWCTVIITRRVLVVGSPSHFKKREHHWKLDEIRTSKKEGTWNTWRSRAVSPTTMPDDLLQP